jgi:CheY-like chemotaxis protein
MLTELGYRVLEANSSEQTLRLIQGGARPDFLVTDHLMPGMTGTELARSVRSQLPRARILLISGYSDLDGDAPDLPRLVKPFRNSELATALSGLKFEGGIPE